jgi:hypothetical protein
MTYKLTLGDHQVVRNIRHRWPAEVANVSDTAIAKLYRDFGQSEDHGNNDEKLPEWFPSLPDYEEK